MNLFQLFGGNRLKMGMIGTGRIAEKFMEAVGDAKGVAVTAIYNPRIESAAAFARRQGVENFTDDLEKFLTDDIDAVYVASPHEEHYYYTKESLLHKKHVLCEKPLCFSTEEAKELYALASQQGLILMEELKTAYCPGFLGILSAVRAGEIGEVYDIEAAFTRLTPTNLRETTNIRYGGGFTEFGSYGLLPVFRLLGTNYDEVRFQSSYMNNGLDRYTKAVFSYGDKFAVVKAGVGVKSEGQLLISGSKGYLLCKSPWWLTREFDLRYEEPEKKERQKFSFVGTGIQYTLSVFRERIKDKSDSLNEILIEEQESVARAGVFQRFMEENRERRQKAREEYRARPNMKIWAHRGMSRQYAENTLQAFRAAAELGKGLTGIEMDVQLTKDGHAVIMHDERIDRVTDKRGFVMDQTLFDLRNARISLGNGETVMVPLLTEALKLLRPYCLENGLKLNIEIKSDVIHYEGIEEEVLQCVRDEELLSY
nr:Gfo/Idh/MocA family oxidoreductase [Lachnospiraceae bacterium]